MNKLLLNERGRNHIRIFPTKEVSEQLNIPETEADKIRWCEKCFKTLQHSNDAKRLSIYKHKGKGYLISVWELDNKYYLIQCLRNEFKTFNTTIYISNEKNDMLNIAKFLQENVDSIMKDYKNQILEARDALIKETIEGKKPDGDA